MHAAIVIHTINNNNNNNNNNSNNNDNNNNKNNSNNNNNASSENNLERVMRTVKGGMDCIGLRWNEKKCAVVHVRRGCVKQTENMEIDELKSIKSLGEEITKTSSWVY